MSLALTGQDYINLYSAEMQSTFTLPESKRSDEVTRLTKVTHPRLQIFRPTSGEAIEDHIIVCPGGGYKILAIDKEGTEIAEWFADLGYTAYVLEYTVPKDRAAAHQNLLDAIESVRSLPSFGSNSKLGAIGFSAGGHLVASVSERENSSSESYRLDFTMLIYPAYLDKGENGGLSPEIYLTDTSAPTFISVSADDPYAPSSLAMVQALHENKTEIEFHLFPEGGHGYGMRKGIAAAEAWPNLLKEWLKNR